MSNNNDSFLASILQYHTRLVDQQFVDNIINKLKAQQVLRFRLLIVAALLACLAAIPMISTLTENLALLFTLPEGSPYMLTFVLLSGLGFGVWLISEDF